MKNKILVRKLRIRWNSFNNAVGETRGHQMFLGSKASLITVAGPRVRLCRRVLQDYQRVERELWGTIELLPEEQLMSN